MNKFYFIGNGAYCYANSTAMLLGSIGEDISPAIIEVLCGDGIGASLLKAKNLLYFDNPVLPPDLGITKALDILGFTYKTKFYKNPEDFPIDELKRDLELSSAVLGPVDMGFLSYNHSHVHLNGADHYVLAYGIEGGFIHLNDPEGFPHVFLPLENLKSAWMADRLTFPYNVGYYRYTTQPKRVENPNHEEIYSRAISWFKEIYRGSDERADTKRFEVGSEAIESYSDYVKSNRLNEDEEGHLTHFALPLGAKRASDYSKYFEQYNSKLSELKYDQSRIFGKAQVCASGRDWSSLAETLVDLSRVEEDFKSSLLSQ